MRVLPALLAIALSACCATTPPPAPPAPAPKSSHWIRVLIEADDGKTIEMKVGDRAEMALRIGVATGYEWTVAGGGDVVAVGPKRTDNPTPPGMNGGTATDIFPITALGVGEATLVFTCKRPWEPEAVQTVRVTVHVRPGA